MMPNEALALIDYQTAGHARGLKCGLQRP